MTGWAAAPPVQRLGDLPGHHAACRLHGDALIGRDRTLSYAEFDAHVARCIAALVAAGVKHAERVALLTPPCCEQAVVFLACARLGASFVGLHPPQPPQERARAARRRTGPAHRRRPGRNGRRRAARRSRRRGAARRTPRARRRGGGGLLPRPPGRFRRPRPGSTFRSRRASSTARAPLAAVPRLDDPRPAGQAVLRGEVAAPAAPGGCCFRSRCPLAREICAQVDPPLVGPSAHGAACHFAWD